MNLPILGTSYKWNHTAFVLLWLTYFTHHNVFKVHLCSRFTRCSMRQNFKSEQYSVVCIYHILFTHLSIDWVASAFCLLWIMILWTWVCKYLFESLLSLLLAMYPKVELLAHTIILCLIPWGTTKLFSIVAAPLYIPISNAQGCQ